MPVEERENGTEDDAREKPRPRCACGIEEARARELCTERDCFNR